MYSKITKRFFRTGNNFILLGHTTGQTRKALDVMLRLLWSLDFHPFPNMKKQWHEQHKIRKIVGFQFALCNFRFIFWCENVCNLNFNAMNTFWTKWRCDIKIWKDVVPKYIHAVDILSFPPFLPFHSPLFPIVKHTTNFAFTSASNAFYFRISKTVSTKRST